MLKPEKVLDLLLSAKTHGSHDLPCTACVRDLIELFIDTFPEHSELAVQKFKTRFPEARLPFHARGVQK